MDVATRSGRIALEETHRRFGGVDVPASLSGMLAALGLAVLLAGLAAGVGTIGYQAGAGAEDLSAAGFVTGLVVLLVSFVFGGWVAGRMARYDGVRNGVLAAGWFILLALSLSLLGWWADDRYDFLGQVRLPQWFDADRATAQAIGSGLLGVLVILGAAALGGALGTRYHHRADTILASGGDVSRRTGEHVVTGSGGTDISRRGNRGK